MGENVVKVDVEKWADLPAIPLEKKTILQM